MILSALSTGIVTAGSDRYRCALGRKGVCEARLKEEGDGRTPAGVWPFRRLLWRPDRIPAPLSKLPARPIRPTDGWCDAPDDACYNREVFLPHRARAERLWRDDHLYDLLLVLGYNDDPIVPGAGSAIFMHLAWPDYRPTEGCLAVSTEDMLAILAKIRPGDAVHIEASDPGVAP